MKMKPKDLYEKLDEKKFGLIIGALTFVSQVTQGKIQKKINKTLMKVKNDKTLTDEDFSIIISCLKDTAKFMSEQLYPREKDENLKIRANEMVMLMMELSMMDGK